MAATVDVRHSMDQIGKDTFLELSRCKLGDRQCKKGNGQAAAVYVQNGWMAKAFDLTGSLPELQTHPLFPGKKSSANGYVPSSSNTGTFLQLLNMRQKLFKYFRQKFSNGGSSISSGLNSSTDSTKTSGSLYRTQSNSGSEPSIPNLFFEYMDSVKDDIKKPVYRRRHCNSESDIILTNTTLNFNSSNPGSAKLITSDNRITSELSDANFLHGSESKLDGISSNNIKENAGIDKQFAPELSTKKSSLEIISVDEVVQSKCPIKIENISSAPKKEEPIVEKSNKDTNQTLSVSCSASEIQIIPEKNKKSSSKLLRSKTVSFADQVGRSLTEVFVLDEEKYFPDIRCPRFNNDEFDDRGISFFNKSKPATYPGRFVRSRGNLCSNFNQTDDFNSWMEPTYAQRKPITRPKEIFVKEWVACFSQPATMYSEFRQRLENHSVSLEYVSIRQPTDNSPSQLPELYGTIKVKNITFQKEVAIRLTLDHWKTHTEYKAIYNAQAHVGISGTRYDTFNIKIQPELQNESNVSPIDLLSYRNIEFAICYRAGPCSSSGEFWDNNDGMNYVIERRDVIKACLNERSESSQAANEYSLPHISSAYTVDFRPNFDQYNTFTDYRSWNHYSGERVYY